MKTYRANTSFTVTIPLVDEHGQPILPSSVDYRIVDELDVEVLAQTATSFVEGDTSVDITIDSTSNVLPTNALKSLRVIQLIADLPNNSSYIIEESYIIEAESSLATMVNSYQNMKQAKLAATDIPDIEAWNSATEQDKRAALIEAYLRIGKLNFNVPGATPLNTKTVNEFKALPAEFKQDILRAQIIEADSILGGDPISKKREEGLMSDSVGQSSIMFRPGKPLTLSVSKRTMNQLSGWLLFNLNMGRS